VRAKPIAARPQAQQQNEQSKSVAGKVTAIGGDKKSFTLNVPDRDTTKPMLFLVDSNTQIQGRVSVGMNAIVQCSPTDDGKNKAVMVTPQDTQ
jgi:hypothetical protein